MTDYNYGTGRRKTSAARVYLSSGKGQITVNAQPLDDFLPYEFLLLICCWELL